MSQLTENEKRERSGSLFGPILLIAIGAFFLFTRLNPLTDLHWFDLLRLWPLLLIFLGLNILAQYADRPWSTILSGIIALAAVLVMGYVLIYGYALPYNNSRLGIINWQSEPVRYGVRGVTSAEYDLTLGPPGADLFALEDSSDLIAGEIVYQDDFLFDTSVSGDRAFVRIAPQNYNEQWVFMPSYWSEFGDRNRWQLALNPNVPADINLEIAASNAWLDFSDLLINSLSLEANAGSVNMQLPEGDYRARIENNAAISEIKVMEPGKQSVELLVNAGAVSMHLPDDVPVRIEVDKDLGSFNVNNSHLRRLDSQSNIWQTPGYDTAEDYLDLKVYISLGAVTVD